MAIKMGSNLNQSEKIILQKGSYLKINGTRASIKWESSLKVMDARLFIPEVNQCLFSGQFPLYLWAVVRWANPSPAASPSQPCVLIDLAAT